MGGEAGHCIISQQHYYTIFLDEKHVGIAEVTKAHLHRDGAFIKSHGIPIGCDRLLVRCCSKTTNVTLKVVLEMSGYHQSSWDFVL